MAKRKTDTETEPMFNELKGIPDEKAKALLAQAKKVAKNDAERGALLKQSKEKNDSLHKRLIEMCRELKLEAFKAYGVKVEIYDKGEDVSVTISEEDEDEAPAE